MPRRQQAILVTLIISPAIITSVLLYGLLGVRNLADYVPIYSDVFNDSFYYWRQVGTFAAAGFDGGYYTGEELPARAPYSHFYAHGPIFPLLYGSVASLTGWHPHTGIIFNVILITFTFGLWLYRIRNDQGQMVLSALALFTVWGVLFFIPTNMQESVHFALAILLAVCIVPVLRNQSRKQREDKFWQTTTIIVLTVAALLRPTWAVLSLPLFWMWTKKVRRSRQPLYFLGLCGYLGVIAFLFQYQGSSYPLFSYLPSGSSFSEIWINTLTRIRINLLNLFSLNILELIQFIQIMILLSLLFNISVNRFLGRVSLLHRLHIAWQLNEVSLHFFNLVGALAFVFLFNEMNVFRGYRQLAPHLLVTLLILIAQRRFRCVITLLMIGLIALPWFLIDYKTQWYSSFHRENADIETFRQQSASILIYDPAAPNAWCNTLLVVMRQNELPPQVMRIHPALGISWTMLKPNQSFRSRYILLTEADKSVLGNISSLRFATRTNAGDLFLNLLGDCPITP